MPQVIQIFCLYIMISGNCRARTNASGILSLGEGGLTTSKVADETEQSKVETPPEPLQPKVETSERTAEKVVPREIPSAPPPGFIIIFTSINFLLIYTLRFSNN